MKTLSEYTGKLAPEAVLIKKLLTDPVTCPDPNLMFGLELEIEGIRDAHAPLVENMRVVDDNSLRGGYEYLTVPMKHRELMYTLNNFFKRNGFTEKNFSERCSIHVHVNCLDMTAEQVSSVLMQYQVFEKLLYRFIGHEREGNVFCVPWHATVINYQILDKLLKDGFAHAKNWQKYTGLNMLPLWEHGTLEFRHMHGHADLKLIDQWLCLIASMFAYARKNSTEDIKAFLLDLNTTSQYKNIVDAVFRDHAALLLAGDYKQDLEDGVVTMKYSLVKPPATKEKNQFLEDDMENMLERWQDAPLGFEGRVGGNHVRMEAQVPPNPVNRFQWNPAAIDPVAPQPAEQAAAVAGAEIDLMRLWEQNRAVQREIFARNVAPAARRPQPQPGGAGAPPQRRPLPR